MGVTVTKPCGQGPVVRFRVHVTALVDFRQPIIDVLPGVHPALEVLHQRPDVLAGELEALDSVRRQGRQVDVKADAVVPAGPAPEAAPAVSRASRAAAAKSASACRN